MKTPVLTLALGSLLGLSFVARADAPYIDPANDAQHFGNAENQLFWTPEQQVSGFRNMEMLSPARKVHAGGTPYPLPQHSVDLGSVELATEDQAMTVDEYVVRQNVAGLIVVKDGKVLYERYELGNDANSRWISYSVAKSVTSLLVGAAIKDGYIKSVDESVTDYLPRLKNSSYDASTIRNLLQMSSGVQWDEDYWWLRGGGAYAARGIFGQGIYINPAEKVVIALHSARADASVDSDRVLQATLYEALTNAVKN